MKTALGMGIRVEVEPVMLGDKPAAYRWRVTHFGRTVAEGAEKTGDAAHKAATMALGKAALESSKADRSRQMAKLRVTDCLKRRPYLLAGLLELLSINADEARIVKEIGTFEIAWRNKDRPELAALYTRKSNRGRQPATSQDAAGRLIPFVRALYPTPERCAWALKHYFASQVVVNGEVVEEYL